MKISRLRQGYLLRRSGFPGDPPALPAGEAGSSWPQRLKELGARCNTRFFWLVVLPTALSIFYFFGLASDIYVSESRFLVRQSDKKSGLSGLGAFLESAGITTSRDDIYTVKEFMTSRDALRILDDNLHLRKAFSSPNIDFLRRFNPLGLRSSFERFYDYYQNLLTIDVDSGSSICTIKVKAFTPELAQSVNEALLFLGEGLVNELNDRARRDMIRFNMQEVEAAETAAKASALALSDYRDRQTLFDPTQQSTLQLHQVSKLQAELIGVRGQLSQVRAVTADSPYVKALEKRAQELQKEINAEMAKVAGGPGSMTQKLTEYERLNLDREFLEKRLAAALTALEQARSEAQRQQLYLEKIVKPNLPDEALLPQRLFNVVLVFLGSLMLYGSLSIIVAGTKEHKAL